MDQERKREKIFCEKTQRRVVVHTAILQTAEASNRGNPDGLERVQS